MGNCIKKEASASWGGEDWSSLTTPQSPCSGETGRGKKYNNNKNKNKNRNKNKNKKMEETEPAAGGPRLVKIKLRRKELEELLGRAGADLQGMSAVEVLARLIGGGDGDLRSHEASRPWRPALQSIPEVN